MRPSIARINHFAPKSAFYNALFCIDAIASDYECDLVDRWD